MTKADIVAQKQRNMMELTDIGEAIDRLHEIIANLEKTEKRLVHERMSLDKLTMSEDSK